MIAAQVDGYTTARDSKTVVEYACLHAYQVGSCMVPHQQLHVHLRGPPRRILGMLLALQPNDAKQLQRADAEHQHEGVSMEGGCGVVVLASAALLQAGTTNTGTQAVASLTNVRTSAIYKAGRAPAHTLPEGGPAVPVTRGPPAFPCRRTRPLSHA